LGQCAGGVERGDEGNASHAVDSTMLGVAS
jgi:hypothetical protein